MSLTTIFPETAPRANPGDMLGRLRDVTSVGLPVPTSVGGLWLPRHGTASMSLRFAHADLRAVAAWVGHLHATGCRITSAGTGRGYHEAPGFVYALDVELEHWFGWRVVLKSSVDDPICTPPCDCGSETHPYGRHDAGCAEVDAVIAVIRAGAK